MTGAPHTPTQRPMPHTMYSEEEVKAFIRQAATEVEQRVRALLAPDRAPLASDDPDAEPFVGIDVAADILGVKPSTVRDYYRTKGLPSYKIGREVRFLASEVHAWGRQQ